MKIGNFLSKNGGAQNGAAPPKSIKIISEAWVRVILIVFSQECHFKNDFFYVFMNLKIQEGSKLNGM